jgi:hypothetical protein
VTPPFPCLWCDEFVVPGDLMHSLLPGYHYACAMRTVLGPIAHVQKKCSCYVKDGSTEHDPPGLTKRQAARVVVDYVYQQPGRN